MPLLIDNKKCSVSCTDVKDIVKLSDTLMKAVSQMLKAEPKLVTANNLLYVNQREFAVVSPGTRNVEILGTDDATTCHMLVIRHTGSGVTGMAHLDGCGLQEGLQNIINKTLLLSKGSAEGRLEAHIIGGFNDDDMTSKNLTKEIIGILGGLNEDIHLMNFCVSEINNTVRKGINYPVIYGIAVNIVTGAVFPAKFADKSPDLDIRSACHFGGVNKMIDIFDNIDCHLVIGPYNWKPFRGVEHWINLPDTVIRQNLSTSPDQEPEHFEEGVKACLRVLRDHQQPLTTLFANNKSRLYKKDKEGLWVHIAGN